jgi:hypothetical protein
MSGRETNKYQIEVLTVSAALLLLNWITILSSSGTVTLAT